MVLIGNFSKEFCGIFIGKIGIFRGFLKIRVFIRSKSGVRYRILSDIELL